MRFSPSPAYFEAIANHPDVFPRISRHGQGPIDLAPAWREMFGIECEGGGWLLRQHGHGRCEVHTLFLKPRNVRQLAREALRLTFCGTDAKELVTRVPDDLPEALVLARSMGFTQRFRRESAWLRESGAVGVSYLGLTLDEWVMRDAELPKLGAAFHMKLGEHKDHADDPVHDRYVGFAIACAHYGMPEKGVWIYNQWARFAGYQPVQYADGVVSFDNTTVRLVNDEIQVRTQPCP